MWAGLPASEARGDQPPWHLPAPGGCRILGLWPHHSTLIPPASLSVLSSCGLLLCGCNGPSELPQKDTCGCLEGPQVIQDNPPSPRPLTYPHSYIRKCLQVLGSEPGCLWGHYSAYYRQPGLVDSAKPPRAAPSDKRAQGEGVHHGRGLTGAAASKLWFWGKTQSPPGLLAGWVVRATVGWMCLG